MKSTHLILAIVLVALVACLSACEPKGPVAKVESTAFDFGAIDQNDQVSHTFTIKNVGDQDLEILRTRTTCGCTVAKPSQKIMKPGQTSDIAVTFSSGRRKGVQNKKITVQTNDPNNDTIVLELTGSVSERLTFDPARLRIKDVEAGTPYVQKVVITNAGKEAVTIKEITFEKGDVLKFQPGAEGVGTLPAKLEPNETFDATFVLTLTESQKFYHGKAEFILDGKLPTVVYYVSASQKGAVESIKKPKGLSGNKKGASLSPLLGKASGVSKKIVKIKKKKNGE